MLQIQHAVFFFLRKANSVILGPLKFCWHCFFAFLKLLKKWLEIHAILHHFKHILYCMSKVLFSKTVHFYTPTIISLLLCVMCVIVWVPGKVSLICCVMSEVLLLRAEDCLHPPSHIQDSWHSSTSSGQHTHTVTNASPDTITMLTRT